MIIKGLQKTTLLDYPGHVAATIFTGGCNFRCPFCHNMDIVISDSDTYEYSEDEIIRFLKKRSGVLDGVCISGGEPTMYKDLPDFIRKIKEIESDNLRDEKPHRYLIKLDTNGTNPQMLKYLITEGLIDYVAMDIKTSLDDYERVAGITNKELISLVNNSIDILKSGVIDYEFRTTVVKEYHNQDTMKNIAQLLKGAKRYYLQTFIDSEYVPDHTLTAPDKEEIKAFSDICREYMENVELRGVD